MNIAFWSEDDGCGTTSSMAAVASVCSDAWKLKTILLQSRNQQGDLHRKLENTILPVTMREESSYYALDGLDYLLWQEKNQRLTESVLLESMVPVVKERMYYLPQGERRKPMVYSRELGDAMDHIIRQAEQLSDITFIDCGSGEDELSGHLLQQADIVVVNFSQERHCLDAYFQNYHKYHGRVIYIINQYQQESIYNRKNLNRLYRLEEEELAVIPANTFFRHACDKGRIERFVRSSMQLSVFNEQHYFMQELKHTALLILKAAGLAG